MSGVFFYSGIMGRMRATYEAESKPKIFDKWEVLDAIGWRPHRGQLLIAESTARHRVASCGRRFGKSDVGGHELVPEALYTFFQKDRLRREMKRREFWIVGPEYCVDEETEILTTEGWKRQHELLGNETVLTLNHDSRLAEWQQMERVSVFHGQRHMLKSSFRGHSSMTTMDHRWPIVSGRHNLSRWTTSEDIGSSRDRLMTVAPSADLPEYPKYTDSFVELIAWYWTEGTWSPKGRGLEISQKSGAHWERIKRACRDLFGEPGNMRGVAPTWKPVEDGERGCVARLNGAAASVLRDGIVLNERDKSISYGFVRSLTQSQLELFIRCSVWADGASRWDGVTDVQIGQRLEHNIDMLHMACQLAGIRASKYVQDRFGGDWYVLGIYSQNRSGEIGTNSVKQNGVVVSHKGVVWCPTTPNGTWLMRRNGHVCFTGNTDSEKEFRVLWNELTRLEVPMDKPGSYNDPIGGNMHISLWNGMFQVHAKSAKYPSTLVGEGLSGVIMAEAAKMKQTVWVKYIRPTLADFNGWSLHTSTPEGKNHFYDMWNRGRDPHNPDWASFRMPSWVNPYVYKTPTRIKDVKKLQELLASPSMMDWIANRVDNEDEDMTKSLLRRLCDRYDLAVDSEILDLMSSMSTQSFNQEIAADFTDFVGRVFKDFDEEIHVGDLPYNPSWPTFAAVDYGYRNPNVWLVIQVGPFGEINVIRELYVREYTAQEFADEIKARGLHKGVLAFYPDPASPGDSAVLSDTLGLSWRGGTGGDLNHRLDAIRGALKEWNTHVPRTLRSDGKTFDRRPQIMWDRSCTMSIYEMNEYRYPDEKELNSVPGQEKPLKKDDHSPEALGRFFAGHFSTPQDDAGPGRVSRASFGRKRR